MSLLIAPSILAADLGRLADEIARAEAGGCDVFHVDVMDGHFVPNLSFGPSIVDTVRRLTRLPLDVHLMLDNPRDFIAPFCDAGSTFLTVHVEVIPPDELPAVFEDIRSRGVRPGLTLNPETRECLQDGQVSSASGLIMMLSRSGGIYQAVLDYRPGDRKSQGVSSALP